jgi:hypothetical protein
LLSKGLTLISRLLGRQRNMICDHTRLLTDAWSVSAVYLGRASTCKTAALPW